MGNSLMCPGFRFHPTDEQLVMHHLKNKVVGKKLYPEVIAEVNVYDFSPCDLPAKSILTGDLEWYFFTKSKKVLSGQKMRRANKTGYWKGTGIDKEVKYRGRTVAKRKTLVFHEGRSPKGTRTNWVIHEYRMEDEDLANKGVAQDAYVICKVFEKSGLGPKNGEQYGAPFMEEDWDHGDDDERSTVTSSIMVGVLVNPSNISCTRTINMTSTEPEPGSSTVTPSATMLDPNAGTSAPSTVIYGDNERLTDILVDDDDMLTQADIASLQNDNIQEVEYRKGKKVMTVPVNESDVTFEESVNPNYKTSTEPSSSTGTPSAQMLDPNASTSAPSTITYGANERHTHVPVDVPVEDRKGKKVMTVPVNESDVTCQEMMALGNLDDLSQDALFNMFSIDESADKDSQQDEFFTDADFWKLWED